MCLRFVTQRQIPLLIASAGSRDAADRKSECKGLNDGCDSKPGSKDACCGKIRLRKSSLVSTFLLLPSSASLALPVVPGFKNNSVAYTLHCGLSGGGSVCCVDPFTNLNVAHESKHSSFNCGNRTSRANFKPCCEDAGMRCGPTFRRLEDLLR